MAKKYLDDIGLSHFFDKLKLLFATKDTATQSSDGLMSSSDKVKLDGLDQLVGSATGASVVVGETSGFESVEIYGKAFQNGTPSVANPVAIDTVPLLFNQQIKNGDMATSSDWVRAATGQDAITISDGVLTSASNSSYAFGVRQAGHVFVHGHKYLMMLYVKGTPNKRFAASLNASSVNTNNIIPSTYMTNEFVKVSGFCTFSTAASGNDSIRITGYSSERVAGNFIQLKNVTLYDLTKMFGAGNEPSTVEKFEALYPNPYYPCGSSNQIILDIGNLYYLLDLQNNDLASLPDGTKDIVTVDSVGCYQILKQVLYTNQAATDGVIGTVGVDVISSTGEIADGADVYYKAANSQIIDCGCISIPFMADGAEVSIISRITSIIKVSWWTKYAEPIARAIKSIKALMV